MESPRTCLFPLRTNCGFYRAHGEMALRARVKEAAILYETVLLQEGLYTATIGRAGSIETVEPNPTRPGTLRDLNLKGGDFSLAVRPSDSDGPFRTIMHGTVERRFHAEYGSLANEIADALKTRDLPEWIQLVAFEANPGAKAAIQDMARKDAREKGLWRRQGSDYLKTRVLENLNHDLGASAALDADVSMDRYFLPLVRRKGAATATSGQLALTILLPNLASLPWEQIADAREHAGIESFRTQLTEIEQQAWQEVAEGKEIAQSILRRAVIDLAEGWRPPSRFETAGKIGVDLVLGLHPIAAAAGAAIDLREAEMKRAAWGACFLRLLEMTARQAVRVGGP